MATLKHNLICFYFDKNFILFHSLTRLLFPLKKCGLSNRFRELRNFHVM